MHSNFSLRPGTLLQNGRYRIIRFINSGGFGCTYEAVHTQLNKRVAIKELYVSNLCNRDETTSTVSVGATSQHKLFEKLKKKFVDEAQAICSLNHPGIVKVTDIFHENGTAYYVMDFIDGLSLGQMTKHLHLSEPKAKMYISQVADALRYVHSRNRLHLDIKPDNILIDKSDRAILIDFGVSKLYSEENGENASTLMGMSPGYAPPEQMDRSVTHFAPSADIYSLGATYYKLLTGITPPSATRRISGEELPPLPNHISASSCSAIDHALRFNKNQRPQTIDDFLKLLSGPTTNSDETTRLDNDADTDRTQFYQSDKTVTSSGHPQSSQQNKTSKNSGLITLIITLAALLLGTIVAMYIKNNSARYTDYGEVAADTLAVEVEPVAETVEVASVPTPEPDPEPTQSEIDAFATKLKNNIKKSEWVDYGWVDAENYGNCCMTLTNNNDFTIDGSDYYISFKYEYLYAEGMHSENCTKPGKTMTSGGKAKFTHHYTDDCGPTAVSVKFNLSNRQLYDKYHR